MCGTILGVGAAKGTSTCGIILARRSDQRYIKVWNYSGCGERTKVHKSVELFWLGELPKAHKSVELFWLGGAAKGI